MKKVILGCLGLLFFLSFSNSFAQKNTIAGTVLESAGQQPIEFATIILADPSSQKVITGVTTDEAGNFSIQTDQDSFYLEIRFIGFLNKTITEIPIQNGKADLGKVG